jgi:hypothetical protein
MDLYYNFTLKVFTGHGAEMDVVGPNIPPIRATV